MTDRLDEIRAREEAATPGPWVAFGHFNTDEQVTIMADTDGGEYVAIWDRPWAIGGHDERSIRDDAAFIANARQDIPYLLAEVERLRDSLTHISFVTSCIRGDGSCFDHIEVEDIECASCIADEAITQGGES